jgi:hypothetical protein
VLLCALRAQGPVAGYRERGPRRAYLLKQEGTFSETRDSVACGFSEGVEHSFELAIVYDHPLPHLTGF